MLNLEILEVQFLPSSAFKMVALPEGERTYFTGYTVVLKKDGEEIFVAEWGLLSKCHQTISRAAIAAAIK